MMPMMEAHQPAKRGLLSGAQALATAVRPKQWPKNLLLYVALLFSANQAWTLGDLSSSIGLLGRATAGFLVFCALSSAAYLVNDVADAEYDRLHPQKRHRAIASGRLTATSALSAAIGLTLVGLIAAAFLGAWFIAVSGLYVALSLAYTLRLKQVVLVDVLALSGGFVLRAVAGAVVIGVPISPWLYICTWLGALFIGFGKRRNELATEGAESAQTRDSLANYSLPLLDQLTVVVVPATLIAYTLYTFTAENLPPNHAMMLTIPFVAYGLFRYLYLVQIKNLGESPEEILLTDTPLRLSIALWLVAALAALLLGN